LDKFKDIDDWEVIVTARISGKEVIHHVKAEPYYTPLKKSPIPESTVTDQLKIHKFFNFNPQTNILSVKRGKWNVKGWIVIPKGIRLFIPAGVTLSFGFNGGLLSRGALEFNGSENEPIILKASGEGERKSWLGVAVLNSDKVSKWKHVRVTDTMGLRNGKWELPGGVTFHKSDILMDYCVLERHKGEDALNIIRSNFKLSNIRIEDTQSDAFDSDFSNGEIVGGKFQNIGKGSGGDAIDLSGSRITVNGTNIMNVSDKAFSVGERSYLNVTDVFIDSVGAGLVSKDDSKIEINSSFIKNAQIAGLMAYIKKNEFGSSQIIARDIKFELTNVPGLAQKGSSITLNGVKLPEEDLDVVQLYQTLMKSSK